MPRNKTHTHKLVSGKPRHKQPTHDVLSVNSFHSTECVSTCTRDDCLSPTTVVLSLLTFCHVPSLNHAPALSYASVVSLCSQSSGLFITRRSHDPSPQLILGAKHAGSQVATRAALERAVIGSLSLCLCLCVCTVC